MRAESEVNWAGWGCSHRAKAWWRRGWRRPGWIEQAGRGQPASLAAQSTRAGGRAGASSSARQEVEQRRRLGAAPRQRRRRRGNRSRGAAELLVVVVDAGGRACWKEGRVCVIVVSHRNVSVILVLFLLAERLRVGNPQPWPWGDRPRSCIRVAVPVRHGLEGCSCSGPGLGSLKRQGQKTLPRAPAVLPRETCAREIGAGERKRQRVTNQRRQQLQQNLEWE